MRLVGILILASTVPPLVGQSPSLDVRPDTVILDAPMGRPLSAYGTLGLSSLAGAVKFKYVGVTPSLGGPDTPNFLSIYPTSGTTPATVIVGLNEGVLRGMSSGTFGLTVRFSTVDEASPRETSVLVFVRRMAPPAPTVTGVVQSATFQPLLAPGALVTIFGKDFYPAIGSTQYDEAALYPTQFAPYSAAPAIDSTTAVLINGTPAPILYIGETQINAVVPYSVSGSKVAEVVVKVNSQRSAAFQVPLAETAPGIFTAAQNGSGPGLIFNGQPGQLGPLNDADHPAERGGVLVMFVTGIGMWSPAVAEGAVAFAQTRGVQCSVASWPQCVWPAAGNVSLTIGGKPARLMYAGASPYKPWSLMQINAMVPVDADSGEQPVVLTVGQQDNSAQRVTVQIQ